MVTCWSPSGSHHHSLPGWLSQWSPLHHTCPSLNSVARGSSQKSKSIQRGPQCGPLIPALLTPQREPPSPPLTPARTTDTSWPRHSCCLPLRLCTLSPLHGTHPSSPLLDSPSAARIPLTLHFSQEAFAAPELGPGPSAPLPQATALSGSPSFTACGSHFLAPQNVLRGPAAGVSRVSFKKCRVLGPAEAGSAFSYPQRARCGVKGSALGLGSCGLEVLLLHP